MTEKEELLKTLEACVDVLRTASRQLSDDHKMVLNGRVWGGEVIAEAEYVIAKARNQ